MTSTHSQYANIITMCEALGIDHNTHVVHAHCLEAVYPSHPKVYDQVSRKYNPTHGQESGNMQIRAIYTFWASTSYCWVDSALLRQLATLLLCPTCQSKGRIDKYIVRWDALIKSKSVQNKRLSGAPGNVSAVESGSIGDQSQQSDAVNPTTTVSLTNDQLLEEIRTRVESSQDQRFLGKFFGLVEELKWVKVNRGSSSYFDEAARGGGGAGDTEANGGGAGSWQ